jgi:hypothetical protein
MSEQLKPQPHRGATVKRTNNVRDKLESALPDAVDRLIEKSKSSNESVAMQASALILERGLPKYSNVLPAIKLNIQPGATASEYAQSVLEAMAKGELSPTIAQSVLGTVEAVMRIDQAELVGTRLDEIERRLKLRSSGQASVVAPIYSGGIHNAESDLADAAIELRELKALAQCMPGDA